MMDSKRILIHPAALFLGLFAFAVTGLASADPPTRVARLGYISGVVSFSPGGEDNWVQAIINRPVTTGDRLWADTNARAELQVGSAVIRMGASTSVTVLNLDDRTAQFTLAQGTLNVRVRSMSPDQVYEVDTPNLAFSIKRAGDYRINVDASGNSTSVAVRKGQAEVYGEGASHVVNERQSYTFSGTGLRDYQYARVTADDEFDRWSYDRDRRLENSVSARYVSQQLIGAEDLDDQGTWRVNAEYGNVWLPRVAVGWSPYHDGHWIWVAPWGWTWVDDAPWGFAVSHYGRWADIGGSWGWVPGPIYAQPIYAPALVAFLGGSHFSLSLSLGNVANVGWFPLCPYDVYQPAYAASRNYFTNINISNTTINNTTITNIYNNPTATTLTNLAYGNRRVPGAVTAVPAAAFVQSQSIARTAVPVSRDQIGRAPVTSIAALAPIRTSVTGLAATSMARPPAEILARSVVARVAPPSSPVPFAAMQRQLNAKPGKPLEANAVAALQANTFGTVPANVRLISPEARAAATLGPQRMIEAAQPQSNNVARSPANAATSPRPVETRRDYQPPQSVVPRPPETRRIDNAQFVSRPPANAAPSPRPVETRRDYQPPLGATRPESRKDQDARGGT